MLRGSMRKPRRWRSPGLSQQGLLQPPTRTPEKRISRQRKHSTADPTLKQTSQKKPRSHYQGLVITVHHRSRRNGSAGQTYQKNYRVSSDSPMLHAFCRVAPSVLFNFLAIFLAGVLVFAIDFNPRTSATVHARRFLAIEKLQSAMNEQVLVGRFVERKA